MVEKNRKLDLPPAEIDKSDETPPPPLLSKRGGGGILQEGKKGEPTRSNDLSEERGV